MGLVTRQLLGENSGQDEASLASAMPQKSDTAASSTPCAMQAASQESDSATICADQQEKDGDVYKLHGHAEVHYRNYVLRADEITYDSDTGEAMASGNFSLDGGPNDDHLRASHGNYNLTAETGRFYDVSATCGEDESRSLSRV